MSKASRRKKKIKFRGEVNEIENRKTREKNNENKSWFFEMINKIYKALARLIKGEKNRLLERDDYSD